MNNRNKRPSLHGDPTAHDLHRQIETCDRGNPRELSHKWFQFLQYLDKAEKYSPHDLRMWFRDHFQKECDQAKCRKEEYYGRCWILFAGSYKRQGNLVEADRVFGLMYAAGIGVQNAYVYRAHSEVCQLAGSTRKARKIIEKGLDAQAQPLHLLDIQDVTTTIIPETDGGLSSSDSDIEVMDVPNAGPSVSPQRPSGDREEPLVAVTNGLTNCLTNVSLKTEPDQPQLTDVDTFQSFMSRTIRKPRISGRAERIVVEVDDEDENMDDAEGAGDAVESFHKHPITNTGRPFRVRNSNTDAHSKFTTPRIRSSIQTIHRKKPITPGTVAKSIEKSNLNRRFTKRDLSSSSSRTEHRKSMNHETMRSDRSNFKPILEHQETRESSVTSSEPSPPEIGRSANPQKRELKRLRPTQNASNPKNRLGTTNKPHPAAVSFDDIIESSSSRKRQAVSTAVPSRPNLAATKPSSNLRQSIPEHVSKRPPASSNHIRPRARETPQPQPQTRRPHPTRSSQKPKLNQKHILVNSNKYICLDVVGKGGSGLVYKVIAPDRSIFALKQVQVNFHDMDNSSSLENIRNEIELLEKLKGKPHIIYMHEYMENPAAGCIYMVFEFGEIDLAHILKRKNPSGGFLEDILEIQLYWKQMLVAVSVIHEERIVHGDLKPANFLCVEGELKLIDFGIAKAIQNNDTTNIYRDAQIGTLNYMSPEAITEHEENAQEYKLGRSADMWSLGCILHQICFGKTPFSHLKTIPKIHAITNPKQQIAIETHANDHVNEIIRSCLQRDPSLRPSLDYLLQHPFLNPGAQKRCSLRYLERYFRELGHDIPLSDFQGLLREINEVRRFGA